MKLKCFPRFIQCEASEKGELHYYALIHSNWPFLTHLNTPSHKTFSCESFSYLFFSFEFHILGKVVKKDEAFGERVQIWWQKWRLAINEAILISHMELDCRAFHSRGGWGSQTPGCSWRPCYRLSGPRAGSVTLGPIKNSIKSSIFTIIWNL